MSLPAAPFAKHVPARHHKVLRARNSEHLALTPVQELGPTTVQAKCSCGGICPLHGALLSRRTHLNITPGIKTLDMAMMVFQLGLQNCAQNYGMWGKVTEVLDMT